MPIHRLKFLADAGALNMIEEPAANAGGTTEPPAGDGGTTEPPANAGGEKDGEKAKETHPWDSPEIARAEIERLRQEAAGYRTQKNELAERLKGAKSQEDFETAVSEWQQKHQQLERQNLILQHGATLPEALRKYVQGDTEDEIKASVTELAATIAPQAPTPPGRVGGGLNPGTEAPVTDPAKLAAEVRKNSRFPRI